MSRSINFSLQLFMGGNDPSWGPARDVYADFADIKYGPAGVRKQPSQSPAVKVSIPPDDADMEDPVETESPPSEEL